ncbi:hypothetical protein HZC31_07270 [Candidatus Woesearchaeota archaeon]|nr:hypothetical protein [Candidatus Woesearchaeota archaeon]
MITKKKTLLFLTLIILLLLLLSCKQKESSESTQKTKEIETGDLFDDVLSGANTADTDATEEETQESSEETTSDDQETSDEEDSEIDYAAPACDDSICTYYETFSSCPEDCNKLEDTTLYDYPAFLDDPIIVVGDDAPSTDVITATVISTYLITHDITAETKLASEVTDFTSNDLILIGNPCENAAIAELLHYDSDSCSDVVTDMNNAVIKLLVFENNEIIIITGYDNGDTKDASKMLTTDGTYNLNGAEEWVNLDSDGDINVYFSKN